MEEKWKTYNTQITCGTGNRKGKRKEMKQNEMKWIRGYTRYWNECEWIAEHWTHCECKNVKSLFGVYF